MQETSAKLSICSHHFCQEETKKGEWKIHVQFFFAMSEACTRMFTGAGLSTLTVVDIDKCLSTPRALQTNVTLKLKHLISASVDCEQRPLISVAFRARRLSVC